MIIFQRLHIEFCFLSAVNTLLISFKDSSQHSITFKLSSFNVDSTVSTLLSSNWIYYFYIVQYQQSITLLHELSSTLTTCTSFYYMSISSALKCASLSLSSKRSYKEKKLRKARVAEKADQDATQAIIVKIVPPQEPCLQRFF